MNNQPIPSTNVAALIRKLKRDYKIIIINKMTQTFAQ